ncbi:DUF1778 domain-containing protein [Desulfovibrio cuneatus]|uniref:type II toxin-antitoxin system TacA family antitoxin n=1 Tax=Desulfovibrio cuneatus TaxID=159728 RepID=UPI000424B6F8|nr:DUF1778 domain-containing protein [Desulfovibrio cuneatus]
MSATATINLRISDEEKALIDHAAQSMGKSRTAFILENAVRCAQEALLDRTRFVLDSSQWEQINAAMDAPPTEGQIQGLRKLFAAQAPWQN